MLYGTNFWSIPLSYIVAKLVPLVSRDFHFQNIPADCLKSLRNCRLSSWFGYKPSNNGTSAVISFNMNFNLLLCFVLSASLSASSLNKYERKLGAKRERDRRSPALQCSDCEELTETSGVVGTHSQIAGTLIPLQIHTIYK